MALPATDAFTGTGTLSGSWTLYNDSGASGAIERISDKAKGNASVDGSSYAIWTADSFNANQSSECKVYNLSGYGYGPIVRGDSGTKASYWALQDGATTLTIYKMGGFTAIGAQYTGLTIPDGTLIKLTASGGATTTLELFVAGVSQGTRSDSSSALTAGSAGIGVYLLRGQLDDWTGDNLASGGSNWAPMLSDRWNRLVL